MFGAVELTKDIVKYIYIVDIQFVKIPTGGRKTSWLFTKRGVGFKNKSKWSERDLNQAPPDYKSRVLATRPRRIPLIHDVIDAFFYCYLGTNGTELFAVTINERVQCCKK